MMPLYNMHTFFGNLQTYRILWIRSRYGSGKTALAMRLAYELQLRGIVRYICSNLASPWVDEWESVQLVDGRADVALVLDEGGTFMRSKLKAEKYIQFMRKLNVILILPSFMPPSSAVSFFRVKRTMNLGVFGLPVWCYKSRLTDGEDIFYDNFYWVNPSEIYGSYDTGAYVVDDAGAEDWLIKWSIQGAAQRGYTLTPQKLGYHKFVVNDDDETDGDGESDLVAAMRGVAESLTENQDALSDTMAILVNEGRKKRGR